MGSLNVKYYPDEQSIISSIDNLVKETDIVLDIGCGIVPINYFRPKLHIMVEPWEEYANILSHRHGDDKSVFIIKLGALETLSVLQPNSVDSIFLLDVIEHLEKDVGLKIITEIERVARKQAVIFTPFGFMPQHVEAGEKDAWGLSGGEMQEHKSGWFPENFGLNWEFHVCESYHSKKIDGEALEKIYGAFFAIRNFDKKVSTLPDSIPNIRRPLPSELALESANTKVSSLLEENSSIKESLDLVIGERDTIKESLDLVIGERDTIKESLDLVIGERDTIKESLDLVIGERDTIKENLDLVINERDAVLEKLKQIELNPIFRCLKHFVKF